MKTLALFCLLALPTLAADTTLVGKVVDVTGVQFIRLRLAQPHNRKRSLLKRTVMTSREIQPEYPFKLNNQ